MNAIDEKGVDSPRTYLSRSEGQVKNSGSIRARGKARCGIFCYAGPSARFVLDSAEDMRSMA
jgi:hypothetical protein